MNFLNMRTQKWFVSASWCNATVPSILARTQPHSYVIHVRDDGKNCSRDKVALKERMRRRYRKWGRPSEKEKKYIKTKMVALMRKRDGDTKNGYEMKERRNWINSDKSIESPCFGTSFIAFKCISQQHIHHTCRMSEKKRGEISESIV